MKFICEVNIATNRDRVIELFEDPNNLDKWQDGFQGKELLEGEPGQVGSKSKMFYAMGKNRIELYETILSNDLPNSFSGSYVSSHTKNTMTHHFSSNPDGGTHYLAEVEYTWLAWPLKIMTFFKPKILQLQAQKWMENFKVYAEQNP